MIFDRISLVRAYAALKIVDLGDGKVGDILFNKTAYYGTKTAFKFKDLKELADYINEQYPYQYFNDTCVCATSENESIWTLLSFTVNLDGQRYVTFVNSLRGEFESAQGDLINIKSKQALAKVFKVNQDLSNMKANYSCFAYIQNQLDYVGPCGYIEIITNLAYDNLLKTYHKTKNLPDLRAFTTLGGPTVKG